MSKVEIADSRLEIALTVTSVYRVIESECISFASLVSNIALTSADIVVVVEFALSSTGFCGGAFTSTCHWVPSGSTIAHLWLSWALASAGGDVPSLSTWASHVSSGRSGWAVARACRAVEDIAWI